MFADKYGKKYVEAASSDVASGLWQVCILIPEGTSWDWMLFKC